MFYSNTLNLIQVGGGTQVKQGDLGSKFSYKLANEKDQELDDFDKEVAHINLVLNDKIVFTTTATVDNSTVTFNIDKAIPVGLYFLEIKIRDYIFPSDKQTIIFVQSGAVAYDLKELVPNYDVNMTLKGILSDLSQKGIDISDLNRRMAEKVNKDEVTNVMTPKGTLAYASLPTSGNEVGWYYYCPDGDGVHGAGNYVWNGTSWYFGGAGDEGYNLLKKDLGEHREEFYCVYNHFDKDNVLASTYYKLSGTGSNIGYCAEKIKVRKGVKYYSNNINSIRKEFSFFEKSDGTRTLLDGQNNISVIGSVYLQFKGYEPLEDGYLCLTLGAGTFDNLVVTNNEYVNDFYPYKKLIKAFTLGENIIVGKIEEKDIDFIKTVSNLVEYDKLVNDSYWTQISKTVREGCGYKTIEIPVKEGHVYSSNAYINNHFSFYNNGIGTIDRTALTTYTDFIYNGSTSVLMGIKKFVAPNDGSLCITVNVDYADKLVVIEGDYCPKVIANGSEAYDIYIKDTPLKIHKTIYVEKDGTGHFDTIKEAIEYVNTHPNIEFTVYVGNGVYDLIEEFGDEYFANLGVESRAGLKLDNNVHLIFSSNSKVLCNYTGDNEHVKKDFSPFNTSTGVKQRGFTLENLNLECSNVRYAIHDETSGQTEPYRNIYKNCFMKLDNSNNSYGYPQCIGGGLGNAGEIIIENCYFESVHSGNSEAIVSYHNNSGAGVNRVTIDGCYFANKDTCRCSHLGSGTNISTMIVSNCSCGAEPFVIYEQAGSYENMRLIKWNNEIRS